MGRSTAAILLFLVMAQPAWSQRIPFEVCAESSTWTRPSPDVQAKIWNDLRYRGFARDAYAWTHDFISIDDPQSTSVTGMLRKLSGLWTADSERVDMCSKSDQRSGFEWIEVWVLLHRVRQVSREANTYTLTVVPEAKGYQWIFIRRMNPSVVLRFVAPDGHELDRWDESAPPRQFNNTVPAQSRVRAANGDLIQK
jgi:hypothetical protein